MKLRFEMRVGGHPHYMPCYPLEVDSEAEAIEIARQTLSRPVVRRDSPARIAVLPNKITQIDLKRVEEFTGNYENLS